MRPVRMLFPPAHVSRGRGVNDPRNCCVCDRADAGEIRILGGRAFCVPHYENASRENRAAATPILIEVGAVVLFAAIVGAIATFVHPALDGAGLVVVGLILALVPAVIWLATFYQMDRLEPEPKRLVLG